MSFLHLKLSIPLIKIAMAATVLMATAQLIVGCDSQPSTSNNDSTAQTNNKDKDIAARAELTVSPASTDSRATDKTAANDAADLSDAQAVSPLGYGQLSFGQVITPELITSLRMTKASGDNEQCYYIHDPKLSYADKAYGTRASVLYQIIDDKVALIGIQDPNIAFYKDINVGDPVTAVMKAHNDQLTYEVDKYAVDGDYYSLIANINFKVIKEISPKESLKADNIELNNKDSLPLQIEYHIKGGQTLNNSMIKTTEWTVDNKNLLKGEVESIDIGIPEAIYLVEGCS